MRLLMQKLVPALSWMTALATRQTLHLALVELKNRGYISTELSDQELDEWLGGLVEMTPQARPAGFSSEAVGARERGDIIRLETFRHAVVFAEESGWKGLTRKDILDHPIHKYGTHPLAQWRTDEQGNPNALKKLLLDVLEVSFVGLIVIYLPSYYIIPWNIFRFSDDKYKKQPAKKALLKKYRIAGKRSEFFERFE